MSSLVIMERKEFGLECLDYEQFLSTSDLLVLTQLVFHLLLSNDYVVFPVGKSSLDIASPVCGVMNSLENISSKNCSRFLFVSLTPSCPCASVFFYFCRGSPLVPNGSRPRVVKCRVNI